MHTDTDLRTHNTREKIKFVERNTSAQILYMSPRGRLSDTNQLLEKCHNLKSFKETAVR